MTPEEHRFSGGRGRRFRECISVYSRPHLPVLLSPQTCYSERKKTRNLEAYVEWFNRLSYLVATEICMVRQCIFSSDPFSCFLSNCWAHVLGSCLLTVTFLPAREEETQSENDWILHRRGSRVFQHRKLQFLDGNNLWVFLWEHWFYGAFKIYPLKNFFPEKLCPEENKNKKQKRKEERKGNLSFLKTSFFLIWSNSEHSECFMEPKWCKDVHSFLSKLEFIEYL